MPDVLTKEQRSKNMKNIKSSDTKIEIMLRKALWNKGYRYRKNVKSLPGKPDIVITKYKIAVFCDGEFWIKKISRNIEHDDEVDKELTYMGYTVLRFWGKDIKQHIDDCVQAIEEAIFDIKLNGGVLDNV